MRSHRWIPSSVEVSCLDTQQGVGGGGSGDPTLYRFEFFFLLTNHRKIRNVKHALKVTGPIILKPKNPSSRSNLKVTHGTSIFGYFLISRVFYFLLEMLSQSQSNVVGRKGLSESWYHLSKSKVVLLKFHSALLRRYCYGYITTCK